jgi:hypothetical protein
MGVWILVAIVEFTCAGLTFLLLSSELFDPPLGDTMSPTTKVLAVIFGPATLAIMGLRGIFFLPAIIFRHCRHR